MFMFIGVFDNINKNQQSFEINLFNIINMEENSKFLNYESIDCFKRRYCTPQY